MNKDAAKAKGRYEPIDCGVHDELLARATLNQPTMIQFRVDAASEATSAGDENIVQGVIEDVFTREGAEYLRISLDGAENLEIRLDKIVQFGDPH